MKTNSFIAASILIAGAFAAQPLTAQTDITKAPTLGPPKAMKLPPVIRRELPNGLQLLIVEQHELPVADFVLVVKSGGTADPTGKAGTASLTSLMLREGTTSRTSLQIADQTAFLGIGLGTGSTWDATSVSLHTPIGQLDSALALFADVALRPSFPVNEFERIRKNRLTDILQIKDRGPSIANQAYAAILYGSEHPYGTSMTGTQKSVESLSSEDLKSFYTSEFKPNNATMIVVGDVRPADVERRVKALFGSWQRGTIQTRTFSAPPAAQPTTIYLVDKPGAPQSSFRIGSVGVPRSTKDFFALSVLNTILGGSFTSRLNNTLREVKGYTYGAGSSFDMRKMAGPFTANAEVVAAKTDSALLVFMSELNAIRQPVPADEIMRAKRYTQLRLPWSFETTQQIASGLIPIVLYDLPADYFSSYVQNIEAVTQADIQRVANQYINQSSLAIVIVGDKKTIEAGLKATNVGAISIRDISGLPIQQ
jgi:predicted Zn-dependent peptidase